MQTIPRGFLGKSNPTRCLNTQEDTHIWSDHLKTRVLRIRCNDGILETNLICLWELSVYLIQSLAKNYGIATVWWSSFSFFLLFSLNFLRNKQLICHSMLSIYLLQILYKASYNPFHCLSRHLSCWGPCFLSARCSSSLLRSSNSFF